jgi:hypothetical protein
VATKAQKLRWKVGNEFQNFENFFFGVHKEFSGSSKKLICPSLYAGSTVVLLRNLVVPQKSTR